MSPGEAPNVTRTISSGVTHQVRAQQTPQELAPLPCPARAFWKRMGHFLIKVTLISAVLWEDRPAEQLPSPQVHLMKHWNFPISGFLWQGRIFYRKKKHQAKSTNLLFLEERARNSTYPSFTSQRRTALLDVTPPLFTFEAYRGKEMLEETINQLKQLLKHYQHCSSPGPQ